MKMSILSMRLIFRLISVVTLAGTALCADPPKPDPAAHPSLPNIILITMDTTRADRMGFLGSKRGLTPNLDAFAKDTTVFTRAFSQAPITPTSHAAILTGTFPQFHQVLTFLLPLASDIPFLPEVLKSKGYSTAAFVGSLALEPSWGAPGFDRGFDTFGAGYKWEGYTPKTRFQTIEHRAGKVVEDAQAWLSQHQQGPFFLWIHLYDPHAPYEPPPPFDKRYANDLYGGEIAYTDSVLGKFFGQLKKSGLYDGSLVVVTADHGESLGAHGEVEHGIFLYDETIHVPLLFKLPNQSSAGKQITDRVELVDIMPTILGEVGAPVPEKVQGQSLLGFLAPESTAGTEAAHAWHDRGAYSQADYAHHAFAWSALQSLRTGKYLYVQAPRRELYDQSDTKAEHNLAPSMKAVADTISDKLEDFRKKTTNTAETPKAILDAKNADKLAALGYVSSRSEATLAASQGNLPDPKDKIHVANTVIRINNILQDYRCDKAIPEIRKALASDPSIAMLHFQLGGCYMEKEDYPNAAAALRDTLKLDPAFTHAEVNLGRALFKQKKFDEAMVAFEHVTKTEPNILDVYVFLEVIYARLNRFDDAMKACRRVLKSSPEHFGSNLLLGRSLAETGDAQGALPYLETAVKIHPNRPRPHELLAEAYSMLGRGEDAKREQAEADRLKANPVPDDDAGKSKSDLPD